MRCLIHARVAPLLLLLLVPAPVAAADPVCPRPGPAVVERPWSAGASLGTGFGFFYSTHGRLHLMADRRLWRRLRLGVQLTLGFAADLVGVESTVRVGAVLPLSRQMQLVIAARAGYAEYRLSEPVRSRWLGTAIVGFGIEALFPLGDRWLLWIAPTALTGYLQSPLWGLILEPAAGLVRRF